MAERIIIKPSAAALMRSERSIGYSFEAAVADIIDNSISADADNIHITCNYNSQNPSISILDDGCGMTAEELENAMRYGSSDPSRERCGKDMGRFGLGMKVASLSQCSVLTVVSLQNRNISAFQWNLHLVSDMDEWISLRLSESECQEFSQYETLKTYHSGTMVVWQDLDRIAVHSSNLSETLRDYLISLRSHLGLTFHRFIDGDARKVNIYVNGTKVMPIDPFLSKNRYRQTKPSRKIIYKGSEIDIESYVLPPVNKMSDEEYESLGGKGNIKKLQGYYIYRNKRLIIPGTLFRLKSKKELQNLARIKIDLPNALDEEWRLDIKKSSADIPDDLKEIIGQTLDDVLECSKRVYSSKGRKLKGQDDYIWVKIDHKEYCRYVINMNHPLLKSIIGSMSQKDQHTVQLLINTIEETVPYKSIQADIDERNLLGVIEDCAYEQELHNKALEILSDQDAEAKLILDKEPYIIHPELVKKIRRNENGT